MNHKKINIKIPTEWFCTFMTVFLLLTVGTFAYLLIIFSNKESEEITPYTNVEEFKPLADDAKIKVSDNSIDKELEYRAINEEPMQEMEVTQGSVDNPSAAYNSKRSYESYVTIGYRYRALAYEAMENTYDLKEPLGWECNVVMDKLLESTGAQITEISEMSEDVKNELLFFYIKLDTGQIWKILNTQGEACAQYVEGIEWENLKPVELDYRGELDA